MAREGIANLSAICSFPSCNQTYAITLSHELYHISNKHPNTCNVISNVFTAQKKASSIMKKHYFKSLFKGQNCESFYHERTVKALKKLETVQIQPSKESLTIEALYPFPSFISLATNIKHTKIEIKHQTQCFYIGLKKPFRRRKKGRQKQETLSVHHGDEKQQQSNPIALQEKSCHKLGYQLQNIILVETHYVNQSTNLYSFIIKVTEESKKTEGRHQF